MPTLTKVRGQMNQKYGSLRFRSRLQRRGTVTLWMVIWLPLLLALFSFLVGVGNLWLARVELENSLEASALAAVKQWGDAGGGPTLVPRQIGQAYAAANCVRGHSTVIGLNYNPGDGPNQNDLCEPTDETVNPPNGNLVFGAIDDSNPNNIIFNAGLQPSCNLGTVLFDVSAQRDLGADNAWGISFQCDPDTPPALRIKKIIINLQAQPGTTGVFSLGGAGPAGGGPDISDNSPEGIINENCRAGPGQPVVNYTQPDNKGFTDLSELDVSPADGLYDGQIRFTPTSGTSPTLTIEFFPDTNPVGGTDDGFAPGDRFRFGADTEGVSSGNGQDNGDGIGRDGVQVTVFFELGGIPLPPVTATYFDNDTEGSNDCRCPPLVSPCDGSLIVNPPTLGMIPNLPCPPSSANNNNGQSFVLLAGGGSNRKFGVRAQSIYPVNPYPGFPFLGKFTQYCIKVKTTALYDCEERRPRLTRVHIYICPGPDEVAVPCKCMP